MEVLKVSNLSFSYEKQVVLEDINLSVYRGDFLAIIGPNGGGKSTLLKLILSIIKTKKGTISSSDDIGYVPQNTDVNTNFPIKVIDVVMMGYNSSNKNRQKALEVLTNVGIDKKYNQRIGSLSGGQRQRVMIARALFNNPSILLLDEPTSNIDASGQKDIYELLKELNRDKTIVVVSHDISVILEYASKVAYINRTLVMHNNILEQKKKFFTDGHFCEVELLELMGQCKC